MAKKTVVEEVLKTFGLGSLVDALKNSEAFKNRLEEVSKQVEENLKKGVGSRRPEVMYSFTVRTLGESTGAPQGFPPPGRPPKGRPPSARRGDRVRPASAGEGLETKPEAFVDIFDEGDHVSVIATLPMVKKDELSVELKGQMLVLLAGDFRKEVNLPCPVEGRPEVSFKNGVFDIRMQKKISE